MSHQLFHILSPLGIHLAERLRNGPHAPTDGCRACRKADAPLRKNCCRAKLCGPCAEQYRRGCGVTCGFCGGDVVRK